jgi:hypothetical protein
MDFRQEETNLTSKFKMQGPNTSNRIMATIGLRKGRTHVLEGARILFDPIPVRISEFEALFQSHVAYWRV